MLGPVTKFGMCQWSGDDNDAYPLNTQAVSCVGGMARIEKAY